MIRKIYELLISKGKWIIDKHMDMYSVTQEDMTKSFLTYLAYAPDMPSRQSKSTYNSVVFVDSNVKYDRVSNKADSIRC